MELPLLEPITINHNHHQLEEHRQQLQEKEEEGEEQSVWQQQQNHQQSQLISVKSGKYPDSFVAANGIPDSIKHSNGDTNIEMEMISGETQSYTSLRDIISRSSTHHHHNHYHNHGHNLASGGSVVSSTSPMESRKNSGDDIPIRNPLVKHAAIAYLQPMSAGCSEMEDRSFLHRLKVGCCFGDDDEAGCISFLNSVVLRPIKGAWYCVLGLEDTDYSYHHRQQSPMMIGREKKVQNLKDE